MSLRNENWMVDGHLTDIALDASGLRGIQIAHTLRPDTRLQTLEMRASLLYQSNMVITEESFYLGGNLREDAARRLGYELRRHIERELYTGPIR